MKIAWDLDNVLGQTNPHFINLLQAEGRCLGKSETDMRHHRLEVSFPEHVDDAWINARFAEATFWASIPPVLEMVRATDHCYTKGGRRRPEQHVVTARFTWQHAAIRSLTAGWLAECGVRYRHLALVDAAQKPDYAVQEGIALFVEDRGDTAQQLALRGIPTLLAAFPYNEPTMVGVEYHSLVRRMPRAEIAHAVQAFARGKPFEDL